MESEEFYDSLENSSEYDSVDGDVASATKITDRSFDADLPDDIIPFYDKHLSRSEINLEKVESKIQDISANKKKWTSKSRFFLQDKGKVKRSYLEMFYAKIGIVPANTARATSLSMSPKSYITCDDFSVDSIFQKSGECSSVSFEEFQMQMPDPDSNPSLTSIESKLNSISEDSYKTQKEAKSRPIVTKVPELGKLGPEVPNQKLELLRKRQNYGRMASLTNRLKMRERKVDYDLQREIKNSKIFL